MKIEDFLDVILPYAEFEVNQYGELQWHGWFARECDTGVGRARAIAKQEYLSVYTVDRYLTKLGLQHLFPHLKLYANPTWSRERFRNYFIRQGIDVPEDVEFIEGIEAA